MKIYGYNFRVDDNEFSADVRLEGRRLVVVETLNGKDDSPPIPWEDYVRKNPEWGERVREVVREMLGKMKGTGEQRT